MTFPYGRKAMKYCCLLCALCLCSTFAFAQNALTLNAEYTLEAPSEKVSFKGAMGGAPYTTVFPIPVIPGERYTLEVGWDDGKSLLLFVQGNDPASARPSAPSGLTNSVVINTSGGKKALLNFTVSAKSPGNAAYLVFASNSPGRVIRAQIRNPADPDADVRARKLDGNLIGQVWTTPLYAIASIADPASSTGKADAFFPLNTWTDAVCGSEKRDLATFGTQYYYLMPVRLEKSGRYTLNVRYEESALVQVIGQDPSLRFQSHPEGTSLTATVNISSGRKETATWRVNFIVSEKSLGNTAWIVISSLSPGKSVRVMLSYPAVPDTEMAAPVNGKYTGEVQTMPLFITESY